jgi:hypothetical protein
LDFSVYPSPFSDAITLSGQALSSSAISIQVVNPLGQVLIDYPSSVISGKFEKEINTQSLTAGIYLVLVNYGSNQQIIKMVKE